MPRTEIILPQIGGYTLYKADFHVHTTRMENLMSMPMQERATRRIRMIEKEDKGHFGQEGR